MLAVRFRPRKYFSPGNLFSLLRKIDKNAVDLRPAGSIGISREKVRREQVMKRQGAQRGNQNGRIHGHNSTRYESPTHKSWASALERSLNPNHVAFGRYGGAHPPVKICKRWLGEHGFENFLADMGERPAGTTIGRFLNLGSYTKSNSCWQTAAEQSAERKGRTAMIAAHERKPIHRRTLCDWKKAA